ncbi:MAG: nuclear transport factor 2 family protein [Verrucomicrobiales bacterium]
MLRKINGTLNRALLSALVLSSSVWADTPIAISDRNAINDLISRYSHTWDSKDPKGWSDLFVKDGVWENYFAGKKDKSLGSGAERLAFAEKLQGSFRERRIVTRHHQTNTLLKKKEDGAIEGETVFSVIWQQHDEPLPKLMHSGVYRDIYVKTDQGWKFRFREVRFDHQLFKEDEELVPDFTLLKARTLAEHRKLGGRAPYFAHYKKGRMELVFIAARHEPRVGSPTHRLIESVMEGFGPECVITEGLRSEDGYSPDGLIRDARRREQRGNLPEPLYAALLADQKEIPFIGGEPSPSVTTEALRKVTDDDTDILGYLVVRHLGQVRREQPGADLDNRVKRLLPRMIQQFELETAMNLDQFKDWYERTAGRPFSAGNLRREDIAPIATEDPGLLKRMGITVMLAREKHLISLEARLLAEHKRVLVIYGSGHLVYENEILKDMLGEPIRKASRW